MVTMISKVLEESGKSGCPYLDWKGRALFLSESFAMIDSHEYETKTFITRHPPSGDGTSPNLLQEPWNLYDRVKDYRFSSARYY